MRKKEIQQLQASLLGWYGNSHRKLPWRETGDPYRIWVSEVMLQQTQVKTVLPYYDRFCSRFPTVKHLADANLQSVLKVWEGLGYYARARNMHRAAILLRDQHHGKIPDDVNAIKQLPGVGDYIAAAVLSIAFGQTYPVVDGNVKRVLARLFCITYPVNKSSSHKPIPVSLSGVKLAE
jgi:A/G-specific adenine glycosylase